jgi:branched-chain amino acid transport system substrate-binding protein
MKRAKLFIAMATLLLAAIVGARLTGLTGAPRIRIGTILPLTGPDATVGHGMLNSMQLAVDEVNHRGGIKGRRVELVVLDEGVTPPTDKARAADKKLADDPTIVALSAHYSEHAAMETNDVLHPAGLANVVPGALHPEVCEEPHRTSEIFRLIPSSRTQMRQAAKFAWEVLGARRFFVIHEDSYWGIVTSQEFKEALGRYGVMPEDIMVKPGARTFGGIPEMLKTLGTEYVHVSGEPEHAAALLKQMRAAGSTARLQIATKCLSDKFIELAGADAEGAIATFTHLLPEYSPEGKTFLQSYAAAGFPSPPGPYGMLSYASMELLLKAVDRSSLTRPSVVGALARGKFETVLGTTRFGDNGQSYYHGVAVYQVIKGHWTPIYVTGESDQLKPYVAK